MKIIMMNTENEQRITLYYKVNLYVLYFCVMNYRQI